MHEQSVHEYVLATMRRLVGAVGPGLDDLVGRTLELVEEHLPEVGTSRARRTWSRPANVCEAPPW